jgi:hypothetical protein
MAVYTLVPPDNLVLINGNAANGVDFSGMNPGIHCIHWYDTVGEIEYVYDFVTNTKQPNERISSVAPYQSYIDQGQAIINAAQNPVTYYSTVANNTYGGLVYPLGSPIVIDTPNPTQPPSSTSQIPPTPEDFQDLYWYAGAWVISSVDPSLSLSQAKSSLITDAQTSGATNIDEQARIYSMLQLATEGAPLTLPTADYYGVNLGDYQTYIDGEITDFTNQVNACTTVPQLYNLNPQVNSNPN